MLVPEERMLQERLASRRGHFFSPDLLASQLASVELPSPSDNIIVVNGSELGDLDKLLDVAHGFATKKAQMNEATTELNMNSKGVLL
jgi:gluconate kinase